MEIYLPGSFYSCYILAVPRFGGYSEGEWGMNTNAIITLLVSCLFCFLLWGWLRDNSQDPHPQSALSGNKLPIKPENLLVVCREKRNAM